MLQTSFTFFTSILLSPILLAASPEEEVRFLKEVKSAFDKKDSSILNQLTCWDRVTPEMKLDKEKTNVRNINWGSKDIQLTTPNSRRPDLPWTQDGTTYKSNLEVTMHLTVTFKDGAKYRSGTYFVGEKDGKLFFTAPAPYTSK